MNRGNYIATAVAGVMLALSTAAHAESWFEIEAGIGLTSATKLGDGMYFSRGFSHDTPDASVGGRVGIVFNAIDPRPRSFVPGLKIHLTYQNWGKIRWSSVNPQDASDFTGSGQVGGYNAATQSCNDNNCGTFRRFNSVGGIQSISATAEAVWNLGTGWAIGVEGGPALFRASWTSVATAMSNGAFGPAGTTDTLVRKPRTQVGVLVGASISKGRFSVRYNYLNAPAGKGNDAQRIFPAGIKGESMLSLNYTF